MFELKTLSRDAIPKALERVMRYRLLNEPREAESICRDVLDTDPNNQEALVGLILALTDQLRNGFRVDLNEFGKFIALLPSEYLQEYYRGIVEERQGKAQLDKGGLGSEGLAYDFIRKAMDRYEKAEALRPTGDDSSLLRWNSCARIIMNNKLKPPVEEDYEPQLLE